MVLVIMTQSQDDKGNTSPNSTDILSLIDGFIEQISGIKSILKGVSVSALILAPLAIALSAFF